MKLLLVALLVAFAISDASGRSIVPCVPVYTHKIANGKKVRVFNPCSPPRPTPCLWPPYATNHMAHATTRARIPLPYPCPTLPPCRILHREIKMPDGTMRLSIVPCHTPLPKPSPKPDCSPCRSSRECKGGKCWGSPLRCTDGSYGSLKGCFSKECDPCKNSLKCATMKCWGGKCIFDTDESMNKCFPKH